jgi:PhnB protein
MAVCFHLAFNGQCEEAFNHYARHLGAQITGLLRVADSPLPARSPEHARQVVHASIRIDGIDIAGGDVDSAHYQPPQGFHVLLGLQSEERVRACFQALAPGGTVVMEPQRTFWSPCYAIVVDRFGVPWKLNQGS